ncbi:MAG: glycosyltransferase family 39 protein [Chloroflexota bacterium]
MRRILGWPVVLALAIYVVLAYRTVYPLVFVPRLSLQPWLMNNGFVVYRDIVDQHEAAMPLLLSLTLPLVGDPLLQLKWGFIALAVVTLLLVYGFARRHLGRGAAIVAAVCYVAWLPRLGQGMLWYESLLAPLYMAAFALWPGAGVSDRRRLFLAGILLGVAAATKQYAWLVVATFGGVTALAASRGRVTGRAWFADPSILLLGVALSYGAYLAIILTSGAGADYVYWAWYNNILYGSEAAQLPEPSDLNTIVALSLPLVALVAIATSRAWRRVPYSADALLCLVAFAAAATTYPRFGDFHLYPALPLIALACGRVAASGWHAVLDPTGPVRTHGTAGLGALALAASLVAWPTWQSLAPVYAVWHQPGPQRLQLYADLLPVAQRITALTAPGERVYVFPDVENTANLYLLSSRLPPKPWVYTYPWYIRPRVTTRLLESLEESPVALLAYLPNQSVDGLLVSEYAAYLDRHFNERYVTVETVSTLYGPARLMRPR